jgi:adenylylsulfate kinase-like enzyme
MFAEGYKAMNLTGKYVYLAGPYSIGDQAENVRNMIHYADRLMDMGAIVYNPLLSHFHQIYSPRSKSFWYEQTLKFVAKCDLLIFLPGESRGAEREIQHAKDLWIPVYRIEEVCCD